MGKRNWVSFLFRESIILGSFWLGRVFPAAEIIRVQKLIRLACSALELMDIGEIAQTKNGADSLCLGMFSPDRAGQRFHQIFTQRVVTSTPNLIEQTSQA
jgi:hypothetical protein